MYEHYIYYYKNLLYRIGKDNFEMPSFAFRKAVYLPLSSSREINCIKICKTCDLEENAVKYQRSSPDLTPANFFE